MNWWFLAAWRWRKNQAVTFGRRLRRLLQTGEVASHHELLQRFGYSLREVVTSNQKLSQKFE